MAKIAVIGGSGTSTPHLVETIQGAFEEPIQVVLIGRSRDKLEEVARASRALAPRVDVTWEDQLECGVEGAAIVLNQVRVGGLEGRAWDEQAPTTVGLLGEETMGAGGFALGYRTLPVIRSMAGAIERHAPDAWFVNLTNPASLVVTTLAAETRVRALAICDIPVTMERALRDAAGGALADVRVFGTNHASAVVSARDASGRELLPELLPRLSAGSTPFGPDTLALLGFLPSPYLRYVFDPERYTPGAPVRRSRADELLSIQSELLASYAHQDVQHARTLLSRRNAHWYEEAVVPVMAALLAPERGRRFAVQVPNRGLVPFLGDTAVVETSVAIADGTPRPLGVPPVPPEIKALTLQLTEVDELTRLASLAGDPDLAIRALALHPLIPGLPKAREFWQLFARRWLEPERAGAGAR